MAADDSLPGSEITVNQNLNPLDFRPTVALGPQGQCVVLWTASSDGSGSGIGVQAFLANDTKRGPEYILNQQQTGNQTQPAVAGTGSDQLFAVWQTSVGGSIGEDLRGLIFTLAPILKPVLRITDDQGASDDQFIDFGQFAVVPAGTTHTVTIDNHVGTASLDVSNLEVYGAGGGSFTFAGPTSLQRCHPVAATMWR